MEDNAKSLLVILGVTFVSTFVGIIASSVALPTITSQIAFLDSISCLEDGLATCFGASDLISWMAMLITIAMMAIISLLMSRPEGALSGETWRVSRSLLAAMLAIPGIVLVSWGYVAIFDPEVMISIPSANKFTNFLSWPSLAIVSSGGDPQWLWLTGEIIYASLFILAYQLLGRKN